MNFKPKMLRLKTIEFESNMVLGISEKPKLSTWITLAIQHVFAMFGATVLIPILINGIAQTQVIPTDVALFASGIGTLIYILCTGAKVPIYLGSSAAYVSTMGSLYPLYGNGMFLGLIGVGLVYLVVALFIFLFGTSWIKKLLPPIVVGPMIMVIGLGLAGIAIGSIGITSINGIDWWGVLVAAITVITAMFIALFFRGRIKLLPILGALVVGLLLSLLISTWHKGFINYGTGWNHLDKYIGVPHFGKSLFSGKVLTGAPTARWSAMPLVLMMPIAFATIAEHIGDHTVLGKITGRDYINGAPGLHKTLLGDGLATMVGGVLGGPANTSYGENTTTVGLSRVGSVYVTGLAAVFAILMSFIQFIPSVLNLIPSSVLGGLEIILFGFIASNGLKVLVDSKVDMHEVRNVFVVSIMLVIGLGGAILGGVIGKTQISFQGTSLAMFFGVLANLLLPKDRGIDQNKMPQVAKKRIKK